MDPERLPNPPVDWNWLRGHASAGLTLSDVDLQNRVTRACGRYGELSGFLEKAQVPRQYWDIAWQLLLALEVRVPARIDQLSLRCFLAACVTLTATMSPQEEKLPIFEAAYMFQVEPWTLLSAMRTAFEVSIRRLGNPFTEARYYTFDYAGDDLADINIRVECGFD